MGELIPEGKRMDTLRVGMPCIDPARIGEVINGLGSIPGLEGKVLVFPCEPGAEQYQIRAAITLPSAAEYPKAARESLENGIPIAVMVLIEHRYVVKRILDPGAFSYDERDEKSARAVADQIFDVISAFKS